MRLSFFVSSVMYESVVIGSDERLVLLFVKCVIWFLNDSSCSEICEVI